MPSKNIDEDYVPDNGIEDELQDKKYLIELLKNSITEQDLMRELLEKKMAVKKLEKKMESNDEIVPRLPKVNKKLVKKENRSNGKLKTWVPKTNKKIIKRELVDTVYNPITNNRIKKTKKSVKSIETQVKKFNKQYNQDYLSKLFNDMSF